MDVPDEANVQEANVPGEAARVLEPEHLLGEDAVAGETPQAPAKRRRGRPRKHPVATSAPDPANTMASKTSPAQRRRGRPRKHPIQAHAPGEPGKIPGKRRGRPKKQQPVDAQAAEVPDSGMGSASIADQSVNANPSPEQGTDQVMPVIHPAVIAMPSTARPKRYIVTASGNEQFPVLAAQVDTVNTVPEVKGGKEVNPSIITPTKRGPGRPRKHPSIAPSEAANPVMPVNPSPQQDREDEVTPATAPVVKRRPGRPRKHPVVAPAAEAKPSVPSDSVNPVMPVNLSLQQDGEDEITPAAAPVVKRRPGRPRKHPMVAPVAEAKPSVPSDAVSPVIPVNPTVPVNPSPQQDNQDEITPAAAPVVKRRPGRPRKYPLKDQATGSKVLKTVDSPIKRGRGRPRKKVVPGRDRPKMTSVEALSVGEQVSTEVHMGITPANGTSLPAEAESENKQETPVVNREQGAEAGPSVPPEAVNPVMPTNISPEQDKEDEVEPVAAPVVKRRPGRPRKHPLKDQAAWSKASKTADPPIKRGRGRPRKKVVPGSGRLRKVIVEAPTAGEQKGTEVQMEISPANGTASLAEAENESKQGTPVVKRGRGSPRVHPRAEPTEAREGDQITPVSASVVKRPRGRPRKHPLKDQAAGSKISKNVDPPVKRKRGRPRKNPAPLVDSEPPAKRPRGRPKKTQASAPGATSAHEGAQIKRKRGRPKKVQVSAPVATPATEGVPIKRKRGRPRKQVISSVAVVGTSSAAASVPVPDSQPASHASNGAELKQEPTVPMEVTGQQEEASEEPAPVMEMNAQQKAAVLKGILSISAPPRASSSGVSLGGSPAGREKIVHTTNQESTVRPSHAFGVGPIDTNLKETLLPSAAVGVAGVSANPEKAVLPSPFVGVEGITAHEEANIHPTPSVGYSGISAVQEKVVDNGPNDLEQDDGSSAKAPQVSATHQGVAEIVNSVIGSLSSGPENLISGNKVESNAMDAPMSNQAVIDVERPSSVNSVAEPGVQTHPATGLDGKTALEKTEEPRSQNKQDVHNIGNLPQHDVTRYNIPGSPLQGNTEPLNGEKSDAVPPEKNSGLLSWFPRI